MKKLFILFLILSLLTSIVNAEVFVNYNLKEGRIDRNLNFQPTNIDINGVNVIGFTCLDDNCENLGGTIFSSESSLTLNSGENLFVQLNYPTNLLSNYGYAVYFFKDGYIPWEQNPNWFGIGEAPEYYNVYLTKKEVCSSKIEEVKITNTQRPNTPVVISVKADVDANIMSAITEGIGPLKAIPDLLRDQYSVKTLVTLDILANDNLVISQQKEVKTLFGQAGNAEFEFTPIESGDYTAVVTTDVTDEKCIDSEIDSEEKDFFVLSENPLNMCYTELEDLELSSTNLNVNENLIVGFNKLSNLQIDQANDIIEPISTTIQLELRNFNTGLVVFEKIFELGKNDDTTNIKEFSLSINIPDYLENGFYDLSINGKGNEVRCSEDNKADFLQETIFIENKGIFNQAPKIISEPVTNAELGKNYFYDVEAVDPNGDFLSYSLLFGPQGMNIDPITGLITWNVNDNLFNNEQKVNVWVLVSDGFFFDSQFYTITIDGITIDKITREHELSFSGLNLETSNLEDGINGFIQLKNSGDFKENEISITADIYELGIHEVLTNNINLGRRDSFWIPINIDLPSNVAEGDYLLNVRLSNRRHSEEKIIVLSISDNN